LIIFNLLFLKLSIVYFRIGLSFFFNVLFILDYIVVGSDSGRIVILEYLPTKNILDKVHQETFGKSGCRRIVPGQYLAIDPKGRAIMIGNNIYIYIYINFNHC